MKWIVKDAEHGMMVRDFLKDVAKISRNMVKVLKHEGGQILINQRDVTVREKLQKNDCIQVLFPPEERGKSLLPEPIPLEIVYEDEHLLVINKQAKMATMPSPHHKAGTIANGLIHYYEEKGWQYTAHVVTRLDRDTSGLMLIAKHGYSHSLFQQEKIERSYQAIVEGKLDNQKGTINAPIARKPTSIIERMVAESGKHAITHYHVLRNLANGTYVEVNLETGRTHQIRVHFSSLGHPLVGDDLYGGSLTYIDRQALHCTSLRFIHPITKEQCHFQSALPNDLTQLLDDLDRK